MFMIQFLRREKGTSLVELAFLLPIFLVMILGTFDFGNGFNIYIAMSNATREGALWIASFPSDRAGMISRINEEVSHVGLGPADITIITLPDKPVYQEGETVKIRIEHSYPLLFGAITEHTVLQLSTETTTQILSD